MSNDICLMVGPEQPDNVRFGKLMQEIRGSIGSRAHAAELVGLSSEFLRLIERGKRVPAAGTARHILDHYQVPCYAEIVDNTAVLSFRGHRVRFMSRIQEIRERKNPKELDFSRSEQIGRIVLLLTTADDETIDAVYQTLA